MHWQVQGPVRVSSAQALEEAAVAALASADIRADHGGCWVVTGCGSAMIRTSVPKTKASRELGEPSLTPASPPREARRA